MMTSTCAKGNLFVLAVALSLGACLSDSEDPATEDTAIKDVSIAITSPISSASMDTTDSSVTLAGTASSSNGIYQVVWETNLGGTGIAAGTENWEIAGIDLDLGENLVSVTAEDIAGQTASTEIAIRRESGEKGSASLTWEPPNSRVDGSPLANLAGYKIYYGRMSGTYDYEIDVDNPGVSTYVVEDLVPGEWFFSVSAYDTDGLESGHSNEVTREIS